MKKLKHKFLKTILLSLAIILIPSCFANAQPWQDHGYLRISANKHYLEHQDGTGFFWLGDTAWHLVSLDPNEVDTYMQDRKNKGFTVIQFTADNMHDEYSGSESNVLDHPNYDGQYPFTGSRPHSQVEFNEAYWQHVDYIVDKAADNDLYVLIVASWGFNQNANYWTDPHTHNYEYGKKLAQRYRNRPNVIFCSAGEFCTVNGRYAALTDSTLINWLRRTGQGIRDYCDPHQLITIHGESYRNADDNRMPSAFFHLDTWCDFYGEQSGGRRPYNIDFMMDRDWKLTNPTKPTFNMEPRYEDAPQFSTSPWIMRYQAYWTLFFGGFGYTYGHYQLWMMSASVDDPRNGGVLDQAALDAPGGCQMQYVRKLMESKPITARVPDQSIIISSKGSDSGDSPDLRCATRDINNAWAFVYLTKGGNVGVDTNKISGSKLRARWYNPRNGNYTTIGTYDVGGNRTFNAPSSGEDRDWILVMEKESGSSPDTVPQTDWALKYVDSEELTGENRAAVNAFDCNRNTLWHTKWSGGNDPQPHEIQIDLGNYYDITGFKYLPRQDGGDNGRIKDYEFYSSTNGSSWNLASSGTFADNANEQKSTFGEKKGVKYIKLKTLSAYDSDSWTSVAELNLLGTLSICPESWTCSARSNWSACANSQQTRIRTCTDSNNCGTENDKPSEIETQSCENPTTYGISNFIQLVSDWLKSEPDLTSDINKDGMVNTRDLGIMMSNWGK